MLRADGLGKAYGPITVLSDVTLDIRAGEVHAIIGENGAGKSTLMKLLSGYVPPTAGHWTMDGAPGRLPRRRSGRGTPASSLVHQEILLAGDLTVAENLFLGRETRPRPMVDDRAMNARAAASPRRDRRPRSPARPGARRLPLAQRQLVQIARGAARRAQAW